MKAIVVQEKGSLDNIKEVQNHPIPKLEAGEVLIKVHAASLNPVDYKIILGHVPMG